MYQKCAKMYHKSKWGFDKKGNYTHTILIQYSFSRPRARERGSCPKWGGSCETSRPLLHNNVSVVEVYTWSSGLRSHNYPTTLDRTDRGDRGRPGPTSGRKNSRHKILKLAQNEFLALSKLSNSSFPDVQPPMGVGRGVRRNRWSHNAMLAFKAMGSTSTLPPTKPLRPGV